MLGEVGIMREMVRGERKLVSGSAYFIYTVFLFSSHSRIC